MALPGIIGALGLGRRSAGGEPGLLDALSSQARSQIRALYFSGGRVFSDVTPVWYVRDADTGLVHECGSTEEALAVGPNLQHATLFDHSGNGYHAPATSNDAMGWLQDAGVSNTTPSGALAYRIPDVAVPITYQPAYQVAGSLGLPLDDSGFEVWFDHAAQRDDDGSNGDGFDWCYPLMFTKDQDYPNQDPFFLSLFNWATTEHVLRAGRYMGANEAFATFDLTLGLLDRAAVRIVVPAGGVADNVRCWINGAVQTGLFQPAGHPRFQDDGFTLAGTTEVSLYCEPWKMLPVSFFAVVQGTLPAPDAAIMTAVTNALCVPP